MTPPTTYIDEARLDTGALQADPRGLESESPGAGVARRSTPWLLGAAVGFGIVLRLWHLGGRRFGYDEAFTAMAGRLPLGSLFAFLRVHDSHPPLDYLLHLPLARLGASELWFRVPGALCSIAALALFAWWVRRFGIAGLVATAMFAFSAFELRHGRTARMYAELELIGVATAVLADAWLRRPRRWHAPALGALVLIGLLTHVSMVLLAAGALGLPGVRRDRDAWRWRGAVVVGGLGWAVLWGPSFLVQMQGGHSDWIPHTTLDRLVHTVGSLVTYAPALHLAACTAMVAGLVALFRRDRGLAWIVTWCAVVPVLLAALAGLVEPVLIDRTLTLFAWAPFLVIGALIEVIATRSRRAAWIVVVVIAAVMLPAVATAVTPTNAVDAALRQVQRVAAPGDVVAIRPAGKVPELEWSLGVRGPSSYHRVPVHGLGHTAGLFLGTGPPSGRTWLLDWGTRPLPRPTLARCAPTWTRGTSRVLCLSTGDPSTSGAR